MTQEGRVIRVIDPITGEEDPTPISNTEVKRFNSRKGTIFDEESSQEESFDLSSGIDEVSSIDDFRISDDESETELQADNTRVFRSAHKLNSKASLAKTAELIVNEPSKGYRNIAVPRATESAISVKKTVTDVQESDSDDEDIMGNPVRFEKSELALFIHTYL